MVCLNRPEILFPLFAGIDGVKGVGEKMQQSFARMGVTRVKDLLLHLPNGAIERVFPLGPLHSYVGKYVVIEGIIGGHQRGGTKNAPYRIRILLDNENVELAFFRGNPKYLTQQFPMGEVRFVSGKLEKYGDGFQIVHPEFVSENLDFIPKVEPQYGLSEGISQKVIAKIIKEIYTHTGELPEWLRKDIIQKYQFPSWKDALNSLHYPSDIIALSPQAPARLRMAYDELLAHQLALGLVRKKRKTPRGKAVEIDVEMFERAKSVLPYELTSAQSRAVREIVDDLRAPKRMFRLLQGDVGAGKTAVAFLTMVLMASAGYQCALLAPTEILAKQHAEGLNTLFEKLGLRAVLMTGADKGKIREQKYAEIASGEAHIVIGTHAIFQDAIEFANLGLAIIDEQHRFGVKERKRLTDKGGAVDLLSMTATPIPRSLALTVFGDMDISILDEKPPGRTPIETSLIASAKVDVLVERLKSAVNEGRQVYWVCPLVNESEFLDFTAVEDRFVSLKSQFPDGTIEMVHGQMDGQKKSDAMESFRDGHSKILVATTVIEVGVDVPNASIMVIEGAERFGLAQLHQLRGRVGRGAAKSNCILLYGDRIGETMRKRLELMRETEDGFKLAEADMAMRGTGDAIGTAQSGMPKFKNADLEQHADLLLVARDDAKMIIEEDPELVSVRGVALRVLLHLCEEDEKISYILKS